MKIQKEGFEFDVIDHEFWKDEGWERFTYYCIKNFSNSNKTFIDLQCSILSGIAPEKVINNGLPSFLGKCAFFFNRRLKGFASERCEILPLPFLDDCTVY